jgi:hypothetical protein
MHLSNNNFLYLILAFFFLIACTEKKGSNQGESVSLDRVQNIEGYLSFGQDEIVFIPCEDDKALVFLEGDKKNELLHAYQQLDISNDFAYVKVTGSFSSDSESDFEIYEFQPPSKSTLCSNGKIFFNPNGSFLNIRRGTHLYEVGERYGPLIGTKPDGKGNYYSNVYEMNLEGRIAVATFYTDDDKKILGYEVRDNQICIFPGVCPGKSLKEILEFIPDLQLERGKEIYGLTVLSSPQYSVEFILTESANTNHLSIEDLPLEARLYLIRY